VALFKIAHLYAYEAYREGMNKALRIAVSASLIWNIYLVIGVVNNSEYALTRAAGGQFDSFPTGIRIAYVVTLMILLYQALVLLGNHHAPRWIMTAMLVMGVLSVLVNAISRSVNERWNAIPAGIIAFGVYRRYKND
jgi:membrane-associated HD superfamily phosphohydrolase